MLKKTREGIYIQIPNMQCEGYWLDARIDLVEKCAMEVLVAQLKFPERLVDDAKRVLITKVESKIAAMKADSTQ